MEDRHWQSLAVAGSGTLSWTHKQTDRHSALAYPSDSNQTCRARWLQADAGRRPGSEWCCHLGRWGASTSVWSGRRSWTRRLGPAAQRALGETSQRCQGLINRNLTIWYVFQHTTLYWDSEIIVILNYILCFSNAFSEICYQKVESSVYSPKLSQITSNNIVHNFKQKSLLKPCYKIMNSNFTLKGFSIFKMLNTLSRKTMKDIAWYHNLVAHPY